MNQSFIVSVILFSQIVFALVMWDEMVGSARVCRLLTVASITMNLGVLATVWPR